MQVRILPDFLVNQIAAGEVVESPASVVKELVENSIDAGSDCIVIDVVDGGRTSISVIDNGKGMSREDLEKSVMRHATSKLTEDNLSNISYMGFRGEAIPSIASVSNMIIDTNDGHSSNGWKFIVDENKIIPSDWESGTRIRVENLFAKVPARLKFLRSDRAEMMSVLEIVKRLALSRPDITFVLNNKWFFNNKQNLEERINSIMGEDVEGQMLKVDAGSSSSNMRLYGYISHPTLHRASSADQYLFVNNRSVKDKVLVSALRAAYMDVMHAREFPLCALYLELPSSNVDVNVSPAKTDVHFLEPGHVRSFIIKSLRDVLSKSLEQVVCEASSESNNNTNICGYRSVNLSDFGSRKSIQNDFSFNNFSSNESLVEDRIEQIFVNEFELPLGRVIGQLSNKYILAESSKGFIIVDQHAAHERITYEKIRKHEIKKQPLLTPILVNLKTEEVMAVMSVSEVLNDCGLSIGEFGASSIAIFEKPADWDLDWKKCFGEIADEVRVNGYSVKLNEKLHLKLANYACHHSVRAGQKLNYDQMNALLRDIERTEHGTECNHGRPVYKLVSLDEIDKLFERI